MKRDKTQAETRRANRGNVPGVLGMAELAALSGKVDTVSLPTRQTEAEFCGQFEAHYAVQRVAKEIYRERYPGGMRTNGPSEVRIGIDLAEYLLSRWKSQP